MSDLAAVRRVPAARASAWRRALADPRAALGSARAVARARIDLRACDAVGARPRLYGRCLVQNWGTIEIGDRLLMYGHTVRCELNAHAGGRLRIGEGVFINYGCSISAHTGVTIGDRALIGQYAVILDCDYHGEGGGPGHGRSQPIVVGEGAWLGARVIVLKGVRIGAGAVVGAGSVVTRDVPDGMFAAGAPARVLGPVPAQPTP